MHTIETLYNSSQNILQEIKDEYSNLDNTLSTVQINQGNVDSNIRRINRLYEITQKYYCYNLFIRQADNQLINEDYIFDLTYIFLDLYRRCENNELNISHVKYIFNKHSKEIKRQINKTDCCKLHKANGMFEVLEYLMEKYNT